MSFDRRRLKINDEFRQSIQKLIDDTTSTLTKKVDDALTQIDEKISGEVVHPTTVSEKFSSKIFIYI